MPLTVTDPSKLDASVVQAKAAFFISFVQDNYPALDLTPGSVIYRQVIMPAAIMAAQQQSERDLLNGSSSVYVAATQPQNVDSQTLEFLLSNFLTVRQSGTVAGGQVRIVVNQALPTPIGADTVFTSGSQTFVPTRAFYGAPNTTGIGGVVPSLMTPYGSQFSFLIDVAATAPGASGNIARGSSLGVSSIQPIANAFAASDFSGGSDTETDAKVLVRALNGITNKGFSSRQSIKANIQAQFPGVLDVSVIGAGDSELVRGSERLFGLPLTGMSDIYVRTATAPVTQTVVRTATFGGGTIWTVTFGRDEYPGLLYVDNATDVSGATEYEIIQVLRRLDASKIAGLDGPPTLTPDSQDYLFSRYQFTEVLISIPGSDVDGLGNPQVEGATMQLNLDVTTMPLIADISDFVLSRANRPPAGDLLVRSVLPCAVQVEINLLTKLTDAQVDTGAVAAAVAAAINSTPMSDGRLTATRIVQAVDLAVTGPSRVLTPLSLRGRIFTPDPSYTPESPNGDPARDGDTWVFGPEQLQILPRGAISPRTVAFCCAPSAVKVNLIPDLVATSI